MTDCERCAVSKPDPVPYLTHEKDMARMERMNFHQFIVIIVLIVALVASNLGWVVYESQFEDMILEQDVETGEGDAFVSGVVDINYGTNKTDGESTSP